MIDITSSLSKDGLILRIEMIEDSRVLGARDITAAEMTMLLDHLGAARAAMRDKVPESLEAGKAHFNNVQQNPLYYVSNRGPLDKAFALLLRHPGFGWLAFTFDKKSGHEFANKVLAEALRVRTLAPGIIKPGPAVKI